MEEIQFDVSAVLNGATFRITDVFEKFSTNSDGQLEVELGPQSAKFFLVDGR
jgi:hypothetical protein